MQPKERRLYSSTLYFLGRLMSWLFVIALAFLVIGSLLVLPASPDWVRERIGVSLGVGVGAMLPTLILGLFLSQRRKCRVCQHCGAFVDVAEGVS